MTIKETGIKLRDRLGLNYYPIGMMFSDQIPQESMRFKGKGEGCIVPLIFQSAKGKIVSIDKDSTGWPCSAFYLGYKDWIFEGIENFLSDGIVFGRCGERFIKTPQQAKDFVMSYVPHKMNLKVTVFKPLEKFSDNEVPELVTFFSTPDELSALIYMLHFNSPMSDDKVVTGFNSGCGSIYTMPMKLLSEAKDKAVWGMHDISVRLRLPRDIMTLTMPYKMILEMMNEIDHSFVMTGNWEKLKARNSEGSQ